MDLFKKEKEIENPSKMIHIPLARRIFPSLIQNLDLQHVVPEFVKKTVKKPRREVRSIDDTWEA